MSNIPHSFRKYRKSCVPVFLSITSTSCIALAELSSWAFTILSFNKKFQLALTIASDHPTLIAQHVHVLLPKEQWEKGGNGGNGSILHWWGSAEFNRIYTVFPALAFSKLSSNLSSFEDFISSAADFKRLRRVSPWATSLAVLASWLACVCGLRARVCVWG